MSFASSPPRIGPGISYDEAAGSLTDSYFDGTIEPTGSAALGQLLSLNSIESIYGCALAVELRIERIRATLDGAHTMIFSPRLSKQVDDLDPWEYTRRGHVWWFGLPGGGLAATEHAVEHEDGTITTTLEITDGQLLILRSRCDSEIKLQSLANLSLVRPLDRDEAAKHVPASRADQWRAVESWLEEDDVVWEWRAREARGLLVRRDGVIVYRFVVSR